MTDKTSWTNEDLKGKLKEFASIYKTKPIDNNSGGMKSTHLFPTWFVIQRMQPKHIIESGTFQGQGTYFMELAAPNAKITSIEPRPNQIKWKSDKVNYTTIDFKDHEWKLDKSKTLIHFDDHQNTVERIKQMKSKGFKYAMFEDNYPTGKGDCYSLKQALDKRGADAEYLKDTLKTYYEFPPVFKTELTRWKDNWSAYETPEPLYHPNQYEKWMDCYFKEAQSYTWICYIELK